MNALNKIKAKMTSQSSSNLELTMMSGNGNSGKEGGRGLSSHEAVQVEPKTYFANERTFIQWISAALLLLTVSSIMMGSGGYNATSSVIAFASMILVGYASFVYFRRVRLLKSGQAYGYLDHVGPTVLAIGVGVGVFIIFADAMKGSEFLSFGGWGSDEDEGYARSDDDDDDYIRGRVLMAPSEGLLMTPDVNVLEIPGQPFEEVFKLREVEGKCSRYRIHGINLLEYQPRDIILNRDPTTCDELIVAAPQSLVSHPISGAAASSFLSVVPDAEIQSMTMVGDRLFALSTGPSQTELIEFNTSDPSFEIESRFLIQDSASTTGSMVIVPSSEEGKLLVYLDGTMHSYHPPPKKNESTVSSLSRTGTINMKVLNRGLGDDPIAAMEHFEGVTYFLREIQNTIEAWDLDTATLLATMILPNVSRNDKWIGMAFQRREDIAEEQGEEYLLHKSKMMTPTTESVYVHMPLDTFPPQLWSFRLENLDSSNVEAHSVFSFPECEVAMN